jgi:hypothetical protein
VVNIAGHEIGWLWLLVDALAVYRVARLVTTDGLLERPRASILARYNPTTGDHPAQLVVCAWCCSAWIALAAVVLTVWAPAVWIWFAVPLALSAVAGYLSERA